MRHYRKEAVMTTDVKTGDQTTGSAKIYQFPQRPAAAKTIPPKTVYGRAWYHDEAIQDEAPKPVKPLR
jgi:hypothetical protein